MEFFTPIALGAALPVVGSTVYVLQRVTGLTPKRFWYDITHIRDFLTYDVAQYVTDYTAIADTLSGAQGDRRKPIVEQVVGRLKSREAALVILHGAPGVGKTALLEEITKRLSKETVDGREIRVLRLDILKMKESAGLKGIVDLATHGGVQEKLKALFHGFVELNCKSRMSGGPLFVLYMDEVHAVLRADILKHFVEQTGGQSDLVVMGATTTRNFENYDPRREEESLERRMEVHEIRSLTTDETVEALFSRFYRRLELSEFPSSLCKLLTDLSARKPLLDDEAKRLALEYCYERGYTVPQSKDFLNKVCDVLLIGRTVDAMANAIAKVTQTELDWILKSRFRVVASREAVAMNVLFATVEFPYQNEPGRSVKRMRGVVEWKRSQVHQDSKLDGEITLNDIVVHRVTVLEKSESETWAEIDAERALLEMRDKVFSDCLPSIEGRARVMSQTFNPCLDEGAQHFLVPQAAPLIIYGEAPSIADSLAETILGQVCKKDDMEGFRLRLSVICYLFSQAEAEREQGSRTARVQRACNYFVNQLSDFIRKAKERPGKVLFFVSSREASLLLEQLYPRKPLGKQSEEGSWKSALPPQFQSKWDEFSGLFDQAITKVGENFGIRLQSDRNYSHPVKESPSPPPSHNRPNLAFRHPVIKELLQALRQGNVRLLIAMRKEQYEQYCEIHAVEGSFSVLALPSLSLSESLRELKFEGDYLGISFGMKISYETVFQVALRLSPWCELPPAQAAYDLLSSVRATSARAKREKIGLNDLWTITKQKAPALSRVTFDQVVKGAYLWDSELIISVEKRPEPTKEIAVGTLENTLVSLYHRDHPAIFIVEPSYLRRRLIRDEVIARIPEGHLIRELTLGAAQDFLSGGSPELAKRVLRSYVSEQLLDWNCSESEANSSVLIIEHHEILNDVEIQKAIAEIAKSGKVSLIYLCTPEQFDIPSRDSLGRADVPKRELGAADLFHQVRQVIENPLGLIAGNGNNLVAGVRRWLAGDEEKPAAEEVAREAKDQPEPKAKVALRPDEVRYLELPSVERWEVARMMSETRANGDLPFINDEAREVFLALAYRHLQETQLSLESAQRNYKDLQAQLKLRKREQINSNDVLNFFLQFFPHREQDDLREMAGLETSRFSQFRRKTNQISRDTAHVTSQYISWKMLRNMSLAAAALTLPKLVYNGVNRGINALFRTVGGA